MSFRKLDKSFDWNDVYYDYTKLSNKQIACIFFYQIIGYQPNADGTKCTTYKIGFGIGKSRKQIFKNFIGHNNHFGHFMYLNSTGHCGLEGLLWAKNKILEFEKWIIANSTDHIQIFVGADDERRLRVYKRGLLKSGYEVHFNGYQLVKYLENPNAKRDPGVADIYKIAHATI